MRMNSFSYSPTFSARKKSGGHRRTSEETKQGGGEIATKPGISIDTTNGTTFPTSTMYHGNDKSDLFAAIRPKGLATKPGISVDETNGTKFATSTMYHDHATEGKSFLA
jgi:hypothetical protein